MAVAPTGSGKTVIMGHIAQKFPTGCAIAHRQELVGQISIALAREGMRHDIVAPKSVIRAIVQAHQEELGRTFYDPVSGWKVAGVDTLMRRDIEPWMQRTQLVMQDEGHHVLRANKWGKARTMFPNARGLLVTATPVRADGKGLGRHADGVVDALVLGPQMRDLIRMGYLTDYEVLCPTASDLHLEGVAISATTGDYNLDQLREAVRKSTKLVGDVVEHYLAHARGRRGVTFASDVEECHKIAAAFNARGVPALVVTADSTDDERRSAVRKLRRGEVLQLVNVDLFGEGFDLPAIEVVSMARPTQSFSLYAQQWGRALRLMVGDEWAAAWGSLTDAERLAVIAASPKPRALIIDHVGNLFAHGGPPDKPREWSLDARERRKRGEGDGIPMRACLKCYHPYERIYSMCPYCGEPAPEPAERGGPQFVDGMLQKLAPEVLAKMRGEVIDPDAIVYPPQHLDPIARRALANNVERRAQAQRQLRDTMAHWAGMYPNEPQPTLEARFYHTFGVDLLSAMAYSASDAENLRTRITGAIAARGYRMEV